MRLRSYPFREVALRQLETALDLYFQGGDLFSVVTLAGAAEEILGRLLPEQRGGHPFRSLIELLRPRLREPKAPRPPTPFQEGELLHLDLEREALFLLGRAVDDYQRVAGSLTPAMARFRSERGDKI